MNFRKLRTFSGFGCLVSASGLVASAAFAWASLSLRSLKSFWRSSSINFSSACSRSAFCSASYCLINSRFLISRAILLTTAVGSSRSSTDLACCLQTISYEVTYRLCEFEEVVWVVKHLENAFRAPMLTLSGSVDSLREFGILLPFGLRLVSHNFIY